MKLSKTMKSSMFSLQESFNSLKSQKLSLTLRNQRRALMQMSLSMSQRTLEALANPTSQGTSLSNLKRLMLIPAFLMSLVHPNHQRPRLTTSMNPSLLRDQLVLLLQKNLIHLKVVQANPLSPSSLLRLLLKKMMKMMMMIWKKPLLAARFTKMKLSQKPLELSRRTLLKKSLLMNAL